MAQTSSSSSADQEDVSQIGIFRQLFTVLALGVVLATIFTTWTSVGFVATILEDKLGNTSENQIGAFSGQEFPTPTPRPRPRLGIVVGHWGNDSGAVCPDELTEVDVNLTVATHVKEELIAEGFDVDLLREFDPLLGGYRALALVSIHADSCEYVNDQATGFKVAAALSTTNAARANRLTACLRDRYARITGMSYHSGSITADMTSYHAFDEIHHETTSAIIETGFLNLDRQILTQSPEIVAEGITRGIMCFIYNEDASGAGVAIP